MGGSDRNRSQGKAVIGRRTRHSVKPRGADADRGSYMATLGMSRAAGRKQLLADLEQPSQSARVLVVVALRADDGGWLLE